MATKDRSPTKKALTQKRDEKIWELRVKGWCQEDIAKQVEVSQATVARSLQRSLDKHYTLHVENIHEYKMQQCKRIQMAAENALEQYMKSQKQLTTTTQTGTVIDGKFVGTVETTVQKSDSRGDARLLALYFKGLEECRKIMGCDVREVDPKSPGGKINAANLTIDEKVALFTSIPIEERIKLLTGMLTVQPTPNESPSETENAAKS